jgi:ligand-binding sensor domain-containing protein
MHDPMTKKSRRSVSVLASCSILALAATLLPNEPVLAQEAPHDPYFMPTGAKSTSYMPRVIIRNMREDSDGNIWFASFGGPIRYDGDEFTNFGDEVGLPGTRMFSLLEDRSGALWFGTVRRGAVRWEGTSASRLTKEAPPQLDGRTRSKHWGGLAGDIVSWIFEDKDANVWFGTDGGLSRYDGESITNFTTDDGLLHNAIYAIGQDESGRLWLGGQGGVSSYDGKSFSDLAGQVGRTFENVRALDFDTSGNLWFGNQEGAFRYDGETLTTFTTEDGLVGDFVGSMIVDRAGNVWLGHPGGFPDFTGGGASRYDGESFETFTREDGLSMKTVYCMLEDKAGNIWFGSADAGACRYDGKTFTDVSAVPSQEK